MSSTPLPTSISSTSINFIESLKIEQAYESLTASVKIDLFAKTEWVVYSEQNPRPEITGDFPELFQSEKNPILCVKVYIENEAFNNKGSYRHEPKKWDAFEGFFPNYLPIQYLLGQETGNQIELFCHTKKKHIILNCSKHGGDSRSFESALEKRFMETYNGLLDCFYRGALDDKKQQKWGSISSMKEQFFPNSKIETFKLSDKKISHALYKKIKADEKEILRLKTENEQLKKMLAQTKITS